MEPPDLMGDLNFAMSVNTVNACNNKKKTQDVYGQSEAINKFIQPGTLQKEGQREAIES